MIRLSPINLRGIVGSDRRSLFNEPAKTGTGGRAVPVTRWKCTSCSDTHEEESEAIQCCAPPSILEEPAGRICPVCADAFGGQSAFRLAVDCCLWKDIDAPTRWAIADRVEAGMPWVESLALAKVVLS